MTQGGMNVESKALSATIVRSRVILLEIAKLEEGKHQQMQTKEVDPLLEDVSTIWALE
ncbi:hypothetical protein A2U01_0072187 [Trifolium medium]|uniref:Uncharacterized protein n=1 Tax=Trifolium medium TaxID=97028 RepID=A0A392SPY7_9FABA|nr:hypothetical protein [Trifolium medium]